MLKRLDLGGRLSRWICLSSKSCLKGMLCSMIPPTLEMFLINLQKIPTKRISDFIYIVLLTFPTIYSDASIENQPYTIMKKSIFSALGTQNDTARMSARSTFCVSSSSLQSQTLKALCTSLRISANRSLSPTYLFFRCLHCSGLKTFRSFRSVPDTPEPGL